MVILRDDSSWMLLFWYDAYNICFYELFTRCFTYTIDIDQRSFFVNTFLVSMNFFLVCATLHFCISFFSEVFSSVRLSACIGIDPGLVEVNWVELGVSTCRRPRFFHRLRWKCEDGGGRTIEMWRWRWGNKIKIKEKGNNWSVEEGVKKFRKIYYV